MYGGVGGAEPRGSPLSRLFGFYRGLLLPANEHRAPGKGDNWAV